MVDVVAVPPVCVAVTDIVWLASTSLIPMGSDCQACPDDIAIPVV